MEGVSQSLLINTSVLAARLTLLQTLPSQLCEALRFEKGYCSFSKTKVTLFLCNGIKLPYLGYDTTQLYKHRQVLRLTQPLNSSHILSLAPQCGCSHFSAKPTLFPYQK